MKTNRKIVQLILISLGFFLILITYFLYPKIVKNKMSEKEIAKEETFKTESQEKLTNTFEALEYKGLYNNDNPFIVTSEKAFILEKEPNIVYMTSMHVTLLMNDGRSIIITSDKGIYNKESFDLIFENNVRAVDGKTTVLAQNLELLTSEDYITAYNNVSLTNNKGSLQADKIFYDFNTKRYRISMFDNTKVKVQLIK